MQKLMTLAALCLLLSSCGKEEEEPPVIPMCTLTCQDPSIKLSLPYSVDTLKGMTLLKYTNDGSLSDTIEVSQPQMVNLSPGYDYQLIVPRAGTTYQFTYVNSYPTESLGSCGDVCPNSCPGIKVRQNWIAREYSMKLTGKLEYTIYL